MRSPSKTLRIGYIPLVDTAALLAAAERGFAEEEGLQIELVREVSWANIRDKLILEMLDSAHILAPLAVATSLGLGHVKVPLAVPFALNLNGNCVTLSRDLYEQIRDLIGHEPIDARETAQGLAQIIEKRRKADAAPLSFGVVFPFSTHTFLLRHWLRLGGIDIDRDIRFVVVPPPYMAASLKSGLTQGFSVGNPWNSLAVEEGAGCIAALGSEIIRRAPEKVLALSQAKAESDPETLMSLVRAMHRAAQWCARPQNHSELAQLMARPDHLNVPQSLIEASLRGKLRVSRDQFRSAEDFFLVGGGTVNRPDPRHARWIYAETMNANGAPVTLDAARAAAEVYRPDLYDKAIGEMVTVQTEDPIGLRHGPRFDADRLDVYSAALRKPVG